MALRGVIIKRIFQAIVTIFIALTLDFIIFHMLPGDPATFLARNPNLSEVAQDQIIREFGLDRPFHEQYLLFLFNFLIGNLGVSFRYQKSVGALILQRLGNTLILILPATVISILIGIYIGKYSAWRRGERTDMVGLGVSLLTYSIPSFWLSMFFIMIFAVTFHLFPITAIIPNLDFVANPLGAAYEIIRRLILPWLVLTIALIGYFALIMRSALIDVLSEDYMITAKAKGRTEKEQLNKEAVPNAMIPVTTIIALNLGYSVAGALQVEVVFSYPGIGRLLWDGVLWRDYPLLQGTFFMITIVVIFANLFADFIYYYLDPRIRVGTELTISEEEHSSILDYILEPFRYLMMVLLCLDLFILIFATSFALLFIIGTIIILVFAKMPVISGFIIRSLKPYSPRNLAYLWKHRKPQLLFRLSLLILVINLILFIPILLFDLILNMNWFSWWVEALLCLGGFLPELDIAEPILLMIRISSIIAHPIFLEISIVGLLVSYIWNRRVRVSRTLKLIIGNKMGLAGFIMIIAFVGLAIFGDVLSPYNPTRHLTGNPRMAPSSLPLDQAFIVIFSSVVFCVGLIFLIGVKYKKKPSIAVPIRWILLGSLLLVIGSCFGYASIVRTNSLGIGGSIVFIIAGILLIIGNAKAIKKDYQSYKIKSSTHHLVSLVLITVGLTLLVSSLLMIVLVNPTSYPGYHILGTDQLGRDVFSQLIIGVRITLIIALIATLIAMGIGGVIGLLAGYYGGLADSILMRLTDVFFVIPSLTIMIILGAILPPSVTSLIIVIGIFSWPSTARIVRGQVLTIKERSYIERARAVGGSNSYIIMKHVVPAVAPLIVANTVLVAAYAVLSEVVLDFFGLGDPSMVSWGTMLYQAFGAGAMSGNLWWWVFPPGIMVILLLMGVSILGHAMDEVANPKLRRR